MDEAICEQYKVLEELLREAVKGILKYQDENNSLFYQVIDKAEVKGNYTELPIGEAIVASLTENMITEGNGTWKLNGICSVAGLGPADNQGCYNARSTTVRGVK